MDGITFNTGGRDEVRVVHIGGGKVRVTAYDMAGFRIGSYEGFPDAFACTDLARDIGVPGKPQHLPPEVVVDALREYQNLGTARDTV